MAATIEEQDRRDALDAFAQSDRSETTSLTPAMPFAAPAERVFGAQPVAVHRDDSAILGKISKFAAMAGDDWYYRFPVRSKVKDPVTGKEEFVQTFIEGPSIKCANSVSRLYGNCDIDARVVDIGDSYMFYARFMDLETGYALTRPFRQRKNQKTMKTDAGRAEDIVFQIGASKAIRNVVCNALEFFTNYGFEEAKKSIIEKVGKRLPEYRERVKDRLRELSVDLARVEFVRGRTLLQWTAPDVALTIAEIQAINDGMATAEDTYPIPGAKAAAEEDTGNGAAKAGLDQFANGAKPGADKSAGDKPATDTSSAQGSPSASASGQPASGTTQSAQDGGNQQGAKPASSSGAGTVPHAAPGTLKNATDYEAYAISWIDAEANPDDGDKRWKGEKQIRNAANVDSETRTELENRWKERAAKMRAAQPAQG